jgi:hypothetical protein
MTLLTNTLIKVGPKCSNHKASRGVPNKNHIQWLPDDLHWHATMRHTFPDTQLLEQHPDAPKLMIVFVPGNSNGLADGFKGMGVKLEKCSIEQRLLLLKWYDPMSLEEFLVPHLFNWTTPDHPSVETSKILENTYAEYEWYPEPTLGKRRFRRNNTTEFESHTHRSGGPSLFYL